MIKHPNHWLFALWIAVGLTGEAAMIGMLGVLGLGVPVALFLLATALTTQAPGRGHTTLGVGVPITWAVVVLGLLDPVVTNAPTGGLVVLGFCAGAASSVFAVAFGTLEERRRSATAA